MSDDDIDIETAKIMANYIIGDLSDDVDTRFEMFCTIMASFSEGKASDSDIINALIKKEFDVGNTIEEHILFGVELAGVMDRMKRAGLIVDPNSVSNNSEELEENNDDSDEPENNDIKKED